MKELVFKGQNDQALTNSLLVAEKFGKEHKHVLDIIRELVKGVAENSADPMFIETTYVHEQNKQMYPMYIMNKDGFTLLAMGFTGAKALSFKMDFLKAFNQMEAMLNSDDYILARSQEILQKRIETERQKRLQAEETIKAQAPKVLFAQAIEGSQSSCLIGELAKIISQNGVNIGQNRLFQWLRDNKYLGTQGEYRNIPMQRYIEQGLFTLKKGVRSGSSGELHTTITPKITGKGQAYFVNKFLNTQPK